MITRFDRCLKDGNVTPYKPPVNPSIIQPRWKCYIPELFLSVLNSKFTRTLKRSWRQLTQIRIQSMFCIKQSISLQRVSFILDMSFMSHIFIVFFLVLLLLFLNSKCNTLQQAFRFPHITETVKQHTE